jgi:oligosaccharide 4-alpha-D-glucosyltransferase
MSRANKFSATIILFLGLSFSVFAQQPVKLAGFKSATFDGEKLVVNAGNGYIEILPFTDDAIRVTYKTHLNDDVNSYTTIATPQTVKTKYISNSNAAILETPALKVVVDKRDLSISFIKQNIILTKAYDEVKLGDSSSIKFQSDGMEAFYGGGSKAININKRGVALQNYNQAHFDYHFGQTDINIAIPFLTSSRHYGLYFDNAARGGFDVGKTDSKVLQYGVSSGLVSFFFIGGENADGILANYTHLTGRQPLPPRWAMGYISSRYGYKSEKEIENLVDKTQGAGIPLDGVVFDLFWYKADTLMGNFTWNPDSFPNPRRMLSALLNKGIKTVIISEPYITTSSENFQYFKEHHLLTPDFTDMQQPHIFKDFWASPAGLVDIFKPEAQQLYWGFYKKKIQEGVSGWWFDLLEPESSTDSLRFAAGKENAVHNVFPLLWEKNAFDGYRRDFPQSRVFMLPRSGYAGMQHYSVFPWTGDIDRSFMGFKAQIPVMLNMGLSGVGYTHSDAGGFTGRGGAKTDAELYSRWLEFAAFTPVMRTHADATNYAPEPIFWDDVTRLRVTAYIKLRYRMLPYNYTLAYKNTTTGRPLMLPVNYFEEGNTRLADVNDEYLWGSQILVAPVIIKGETTKKVLFPAGEWIGFNDLKSYRDSAEVTAPIDSLPLFVKAGAIIPMLKQITNTAQYKGDELILKYYIGSNDAPEQSQWFYDNGADPNSLKNGQYDLVSFTSSATANGHQISIKPQHLITKQKSFKLVIPGKIIKAVTFSNQTKYNLVSNTATNQTEVNFNWDGRPLVINLQ